MASKDSGAGTKPEGVKKNSHSLKAIAPAEIFKKAFGSAKRSPDADTFIIKDVENFTIETSTMPSARLSPEYQALLKFIDSSQAEWTAKDSSILGFSILEPVLARTAELVRLKRADGQDTGEVFRSTLQEARFWHERKAPMDPENDPRHPILVLRKDLEISITKTTKLGEVMTESADDLFLDGPIENTREIFMGATNVASSRLVLMAITMYAIHLALIETSAVEDWLKGFVEEIDNRLQVGPAPTKDDLGEIYKYILLMVKERTVRILDHVLRLSRLVRRAAVPAVSSIGSLSGRLTLHLAPHMRGRSIGSGGTRGEVLLSRLLRYKMQSASARGHKASRRQPATPKKLRKLFLILRPESPVRHDDVGDVVADQLAKRVDVVPASQRVASEMAVMLCLDEARVLSRVDALNGFRAIASHEVDEVPCLYGAHVFAGTDNGVDRYTELSLEELERRSQGDEVGSQICGCEVCVRRRENLLKRPMPAAAKDVKKKKN
ncbi:hypothetical protein IWX46DRAFT_641275 [Phyllosticta citricarpa]|uniref:Uncharacterized protein n=1 Tax=Phyllosticta citricarpa TaxID=55181 RepID=A0ABR1MBT9_9PEZI